MRERDNDPTPDDEAEVPWGEMGRGVPAGMGSGDMTEEEGAQAGDEAVAGGEDEDEA
jgi:hypothetical protein